MIAPHYKSDIELNYFCAGTYCCCGDDDDYCYGLDAFIIDDVVTIDPVDAPMKIATARGDSHHLARRSTDIFCLWRQSPLGL